MHWLQPEPSININEVSCGLHTTGFAWASSAELAPLLVRHAKKPRLGDDESRCLKETGGGLKGPQTIT